jgi:hypothetical protein
MQELAHRVQAETIYTRERKRLLNFLAGYLESSCRQLFVFPQELMVFAHSYLPSDIN